MKAFYGFGIYLLLGSWLVISPYVLGFADHLYAYWNAITTGAASFAVAMIGMYCSREASRERGFSPKSAKAT